MSFDLSSIGVKRNVPQVDFTSYCGLIIAPPKFGKTTLVGYYPNSVLIPFEKGDKATVGNVVSEIDTIRDFLKWLNLVEKHRKEIGDSIQTIAIDTVNAFWKQLQDYTLEELGKLDGARYSRPKDVPHGQFYPARDSYAESIIKKIFDLGFNPVFITHSEVKTITPKNAESYDVYSSTMDSRLAKIINPLVDYIIYGERIVLVDDLGNEKPTRCIRTRGTESVVAGNRVFVEGDITFEDEKEAMTKFQQQFRDGIQKKLDLAGITDTIEELQKKQREERAKKVQKYLDQQNEMSKEDMLNIIKQQFSMLNDDKKISIQNILKENQIQSFANVDAIDISILKDILKVIQS